MNLLDKPSVDDLLSQCVVKDYGTHSVVSLPGVNLLESQQADFLAKLEEQTETISAPPDANTFANMLSSRLLELTPPPDDDEDKEEMLSLERQAREYLEGVGCPPCYPAELEFPVQSPPERYRAIISYFKSLPGTEELVLRAQQSNWKAFQQFQEKNRRYYVRHKIKPFSDFEEAVRQRRLRHGLEGDVHLRPEAEQQNQRENWVEFQDYHLQRHEGFRKEIEDLKTKLNTARENSGHAEGEAESYEVILKSTEGRLERHETLLGWIEQQRVEMAAKHTTSTKGGPGEGDIMRWEAGRRVSPRRSPREQATRSVLAPVPSRVSKTKPQKKKVQPPRKLKAQKEELPIADLSAPAIGTTRTSSRREKKPRRTREQKALGLLQPGKVTKATRSSATRSRRATQGRAVDGASSQREAAPGVLTTRYGRATRKPERWVPGLR